MIMNFKNAHEAYWFVMNHPKLIYQGCIDPWIEITPHLVNGDGYISDNQAENVNIAWWIECGPYVDDEHEIAKSGMIASHDWDLDCGGATADEAMMELARLVFEKYGGY